MSKICPASLIFADPLLDFTCIVYRSDWDQLKE